MQRINLRFPILISKTTWRHLVLAALISGAACSATACRLGRAAPSTPIAITLPDQYQTSENLASDLETYTVQRGEVAQLEVYTGRVTPARQEDLFFRRAGRVTEVLVEDGDKVQAGDLIAVLDNEILEINLESAMLGWSIAKEDLANAQDDLEYRRRQAELNLQIAKLNAGDTGQGAVNASTILTDSAPSQIRALQVQLAQLTLDRIDEINPVLELNVKRAELAVTQVKQSILEGQLTAPFDGEVRFINLPRDKDDFLAVQAYAAVARLVDPASVKIELNLPRIQLEPLREGMKVEVSAVSLEGKTLPGIISALPRPFGSSPGSLTEVTLANPGDGEQLREGINVGVTIHLQSKTDALVIPRAALQEESGLFYVNVRDGEQVYKVNIGVGIMGSDLVEILAGLEEGQTVVAPSR